MVRPERGQNGGGQLESCPVGDSTRSLPAVISSSAAASGGTIEEVALRVKGSKMFGPCREEQLVRMSTLTLETQT